MQEEQVEAVEQIEQPTGQTTATPPTTLEAIFTEGLLIQVLAELKENPLLHKVHTEALVQVAQFSEQAEQTPLER